MSSSSKAKSFLIGAALGLLGAGAVVTMIGIEIAACHLVSPYTHRYHRDLTVI